MSISNVTQTLSTLGTACLNSPIIALRTFSGVVAIEMAIRTIVDLGKLSLDNKGAASKLGKDLGRALFYGIAATNFLPGAGVIASLTFIIHSTFEAYEREQRGIQNNDYYLSTLVGVSVKTVLDYTIAPLCRSLKDLASKLCTVFCKVLGSCPDIFCNQSFAAVGALLALGCTYQLLAGGFGLTKLFFSTISGAAAAA
jgi:hypothetical protein